MTAYVLNFDQINRTSLPYVGGKGANLGELSQARFPVPGGFCVTTEAYKKFISTSSEMNGFFSKLDVMNTANLNELRDIGERIRSHLQSLPIPSDISKEILKAWTKHGTECSYAIRSSATAEDLPNASFAGQQDTYLNIKGQEALLEHVRKCWASLFTDRAIAYRAKNGFNHCGVYLSIVVQKMVIPDVSGILFTADPVDGNRTVISIDASFGLGEALVSGLVSADLYKVKAGSIISRKISQKKVAVYALPDGGTETKELPTNQQERQVLTNEQIIELAALGQRIQQHYGRPQDIEFCVTNGEISVVQSRPITTLYPLPDLPMRHLRVLLSFGHVQMMTDAMKPLGISMLRIIFPANVFLEAGGRLFIDLTDLLHYLLGRVILPKLLTNADEAMSRSVDAIIKRSDFNAGYQRKNSDTVTALRKLLAPVLKKAWKHLRSGDPQSAKPQVDEFIKVKVNETRQTLSRLQGADRIKEVKHQLDRLISHVATGIIHYVIPGIIANVLLKKIIARKTDAITDYNKLNMSLPGNVTSEMGLELGDLADLLRELPEVQEYLKVAKDQTFYRGLDQVSGGHIFRQSFEAFIEKYGMRCPGEIDVTNARWYEAPTLLSSALFSHIRSLTPGEHRERFAAGEKEAKAAISNIMHSLEGNYLKTRLVNRLIEVYRHMGGLREHHKYYLVTVMSECKKAILVEAKGLVQNGVLAQAEDVFFLSIDEIIQLLEHRFEGDVSALILERKQQYQWHQSLKPPRVMTSEGEIVVVAPARDNMPEGALIGSPVSAGIAEGIARVVLRPENAILNEGEILVAPHTDPGWTPLFQSAIAIVTEVGGLMTHGAVVAREYGIPAVVGVDEATTRIKDGQKIRVDGIQGTIYILEQG